MGASGLGKSIRSPWSLARSGSGWIPRKISCEDSPIVSKKAEGAGANNSLLCYFIGMLGKFYGMCTYIFRSAYIYTASF
jgi:hypothetical protein